MTLTLYFREYCSLCHSMRDALQSWLSRESLQLQIIDIDADEESLARYDELVPVLVGDDGQEICHYHLDEAALSAWISQRRARTRVAAVPDSI